MQINTKFNLDDYVYPISKGTKTISHTCKVCKGKGVIQVQGESFNCPKCYGRKVVHETLPEMWRIIERCIGQVGQVRVEITSEEYDDEASRYTYMLSSTGVGTGTLWKEEDLFLDKKEAQAICDEHNTKEIVNE